MIDEYAAALADAIEGALPRWVERCVDRTYRAWAGPPPGDLMTAARAAGEEARAALLPRLRQLLGADVDEQWTTPLAVCREGVAWPTKVLAGAGVPSVGRDAVDRAMFPDDPYGLTPATFADLDQAVTDPAVAWGAAKAWEHRRRHQP